LDSLEKRLFMYFNALHSQLGVARVLANSKLRLLYNNKDKYR
jgi:hypothetical protein